MIRLLLFTTAILLTVPCGLSQVVPPEVSLVHVKFAYDVSNQDCNELEDGWVYPSKLVFAAKSNTLRQFLQSSSNTNANTDHVVKYEDGLVMLRDKLWNALYGKVEPSMKTIMSIVQMIVTIGLDKDENVIKFMLPNVYIYHEADHKRHPHFYTLTNGPESLSLDGIQKYLQFVKDHRQLVQEKIATEYRIKSPFGLGDNVMLSLLDHHQDVTELRKLYVSHFTLVTRSGMFEAERELIKVVHQSNGTPKLYDHMFAKLLVQQEDSGLYQQTMAPFEVPWEYGGCSEFPSISQLRAELVDRVGNHTYRYAPVTDPIFTSKALRRLTQKNDEVKCKRACVDHLDTGLGFEVAVACGQSGCVPLAITISDAEAKKQMDVPLRRLPAFLFAAVVTGKWAQIVDLEKILAEIIAYSHTSSLPFTKRLLKLSASGAYHPPHLLMYREAVDRSVFERILLMVEAMTGSEDDMERTEAIRPNWERSLMLLVDAM